MTGWGSFCPAQSARAKYQELPVTSGELYNWTVEFPQSQLNMEIKLAPRFVTVIYFFPNCIFSREPLNPHVGVKCPRWSLTDKILHVCHQQTVQLEWQLSCNYAKKECWILKSVVSFQRKKRSKEKPAASEPTEEVLVEESVAIVQESPHPAARKRRRRHHKVGVETVTAASSQQVRNVSPVCHRGPSFLASQNHFLCCVCSNRTA